MSVDSVALSHYGYHFAFAPPPHGGAIQTTTGGLD
jgi:hypothetical protein